MKKWVKALALGAAVTVLAAGPVYAEWRHDGTGWWYAYADGTYPQGGLAGIDGAAYYFDANGYMQTGWVYINYKWYYFDGHGPKAYGWRQLDGKWYYLNPSRDGEMHTGWLDLDGSRYYMDPNGVMQTGVFYLPDGASGSQYAYQADQNGALIRNQTISQGTRQVRYDEQGRITFRNSKTEEDHERYGTDIWQPLLSQNRQDDIANTEESELRVSQDYLWNAYEDQVKKAKKADRPEALEEWKEEVRDELEDYMTSVQIEDFIAQVIREES